MKIWYRKNWIQKGISSILSDILQRKQFAVIPRVTRAAERDAKANQAGQSDATIRIDDETLNAQ